MILPPGLAVLASIGAMRPVFLIVMGASLCLIVWRLYKAEGDAATRLMWWGGLSLGLGYGLVMPMYEAGWVVPLSKVGYVAGDVQTAIWMHLAKLVLMNVGWISLGVGLSWHAGVFARVGALEPVEEELGELGETVEGKTRVKGWHETVA